MGGRIRIPEQHGRPPFDTGLFQRNHHKTLHNTYHRSAKNPAQSPMAARHTGDGNRTQTHHGLRLPGTALCMNSHQRTSSCTCHNSATQTDLASHHPRADRIHCQDSIPAKENSAKNEHSSGRVLDPHDTILRPPPKTMLHIGDPSYRRADFSSKPDSLAAEFPTPNSHHRESTDTQTTSTSETPATPQSNKPCK
ncbi:hypothetical protein MYSTI_03925 [Myxococcus stipitatus DSM 14675]|uniref:Uncharacterized protein n=1 Tax=Myxococcus stipitatus (strain DSM 14675 / JCM 12634 / Mx s8) TaxID=1278073 RepID=L7U8H7_MYXSD|nr:hypothetical protein MYSTI_03925 [Myxococcus stipitatus DSM 14675]